MIKNMGKYMLYIIVSFIAAYIFGYASYYIYVYFGIHNSGVMAPFLEEAQKLLFLLISFGFGLTYTLVLSLWELADYLTETYLAYNTIASHYIIMRLLVVVMHISCCLITNMGVELYRKWKEKFYIIIALSCAILVHLMWNTFLGRAIYDFILLFY